MSGVLRALVLAVAVALALSTPADAQRGRRFNWMSGDASPIDYDGRVVIVRLWYPHYPGWSYDYPEMEQNLTLILKDVSALRMHPDGSNIFRMDDPELLHFPVAYLSEPGYWYPTPTEAEGLRTYLQKGGFLWVDDFWGSAAWENWSREISRVLPPAEYPMFDIPLTHPIMHTVYDVKDFLQVSAISFWYSSGGQVSERGRDSAEVHYRGIQDSHGRLMVLSTHNTDVADTWEREGESAEYFNLFSPRGYAIGVNVVLYALTH